ncbi:MAG: hypothetical protein NXI31_00310 [bacterium]|nr:hypothetical protein [bacterium]
MAATTVSARKPRRLRRRLLFVLIALVLVAGVTGALLEIGFRLFWRLPPQYAMFEQAGLYAATGDGGIGLAPGFRGALDVDGKVTDLRINSLGMRGPEPRPGADGRPRVLVLGDSIVFGFMCAEEDALPPVLAEELRRRGIDATVGNGGIPGFGTKHMAGHMAWLDRAFQADAFVFCSSPGNDGLDDMRQQFAICAGMRFSGHMARLVNESARMRAAVYSRAWLWLETWIYTNQPGWSPLLNVQPDMAEPLAMAGMPGAYPGFQRSFAGMFLDARDPQTIFNPGTWPPIPRVYATIRASFERARAIAGERPLVFTVIPTLWQFDDEARVAKFEDLRFDPADYEKGLAIKRWVEVGTALGEATLDVTPTLAAAPDRAGLFVDGGGHYSRSGSELIAREIAERLAPLLR